MVMQIFFSLLSTRLGISKQVIAHLNHEAADYLQLLFII